MRALLGLPGQEPVVCDLPILPDKSARVEWHEDEGGGECGNMTEVEWWACVGLGLLYAVGIPALYIMARIWLHMRAIERGAAR